MEIHFKSIAEFMKFADKNIDWRDPIRPAEAVKMMSVTRQTIHNYIENSDFDAVYIDKGLKTEEILLMRQQVLFKSQQGKPKGNPNSWYMPQVKKNPAMMTTEEFRCSVCGYTADRLNYTKEFLNGQHLPANGSKNSNSIEALMSWLEKLNAPLTNPEPIEVYGYFMKANLLSQGLWQGEHRSSEIIEKNPMSNLQKWCFVGYNSWAPSMDINPSLSVLLNNNEGNTKNYPYLNGQVGSEDEAFSISVMISSERKDILAIIAEELSNGHYAFPVKIKGTLIHKNMLSDNDKKILGHNYDYCIKITEKNEYFTPISTKKIKKDWYSGYLWICLGEASKRPTFSNTFWCFEHTDLTNIDAIKYNMDSLQRKIEYIRNMNKELHLSIIQKSMPIIDGTPEFESELFYSLLMNDRNPK